jgi:endonuclease YncB( thermonuclease family)
MLLSMKEAKLWFLFATFAALLFASCSACRTATRQGNAPRASSPPSGYQSRSKQTSPLSYFSGRVVSIEDGDTIVVLDADSRTNKIRLAGIDAPEGGQAFGDRSRQNLSDEVFGKDVVIEWFKRDRYGRIVGKVLLDGRDVCLEQVRVGMAWHYKYYQTEQTPEDRRLYADAEDQARASRRGLWVDVNPIPPWEFRNGRQGESIHRLR